MFESLKRLQKLQEKKSQMIKKIIIGSFHSLLFIQIIFEKQVKPKQIDYSYVIDNSSPLFFFAVQNIPLQSPKSTYMDIKYQSDCTFLGLNNFMSSKNYPQPPSHKTFTFGRVTIDSNFDSANCSYAERISANTYGIWIGSDHPKNIYRLWFYFSVEGVPKSTLVNFQIMNMQNQSKLLYEGLTPVVREGEKGEWKQISHKVNLATIALGDNEMEWTFTHQFLSNQKHYFAFFYPWSNDDNSQFLNSIQERVASDKDIYFHRGTIIHTLEGRPVEMLTISSIKGITERQQTFDDNLLFANGERPKIFQGEKKYIIIGARVHPGEVPGSHVMTGVIDELTKDSKMGRILRENFVFLIFPIFNPDGVARGHFRVDTNGINLNRCYINPSPRDHSSIYAVKRVIMYCHSERRYFAFLDLHAQASRKGNFIYGNSINELNKQVEACLFAKILSLNSQNFEYEGSNFMEKHMYLKDKFDHVSKEGCGRVAMFHATKNPNSWTVECSYHMSQRLNILEPRKQEEDETIRIDEDNLDQSLIKNYKTFPSKQTEAVYTIQTYRDLGREILESLLDLNELNPYSRITNPNNYFKNIANVKLSLAMALIRMAPNRFEPYFRKIFFMMQTENEKIINRCFRALYLMIIKKATLPKLAEFLRDQDATILYPAPISDSKRGARNFRKGTNRHSHKPIFVHNQAKLQARLEVEEDYLRMKSTNSIALPTEDSPQKTSSSPQSCYSQMLTRKTEPKESKDGRQGKNPVIKIVEIDKQIHLKHAVKEEIRMFGLNSLPSKEGLSQTRYEFQAQITNFGEWKRKDKGRNQSFSLRKTYNEVFKLQILPKLIGNQKISLPSGTILKHHKSLK